MPAKDIGPKEPASPQEVYQALCGAASQDAATVQVSSQLLLGYQDHPGTYDQLHSIAAQRNSTPSVPLDVRRMAIIQFKNGALNVWKNKRYSSINPVITAADHAIWVFCRLFPEHLRTNVRARTMSFLYEEDNIVCPLMFQSSGSVHQTVTRLRITMPSLSPRSREQIFLHNGTSGDMTPISEH